MGSSHPKTMSEMKTPLAKYISVDPGKNLHFSVKKNTWGDIVERTFFNIRN